MLRNKLIALGFFACSIFSLNSEAAINWNWDNKPCHPFYIGLTGGYGQTTWGQLVPEEENVAMSLSTPIDVSEGGFLWGVYGGYEFIKAFALETSYMHYPSAKLRFDPISLFSFNNNGRTQFVTNTESVSLVAKVMLPIPCTKFRLYSGFGAAGVHRSDFIANIWRLSPTFNFGFNYEITERAMLEVGTEYTAGYGQSELDPAQDYIPFLYSGFVRLAYHF